MVDLRTGDGFCEGSGDIVQLHSAHYCIYYGFELYMDCNMDCVYNREERGCMSVKCVFE